MADLLQFKRLTSAVLLQTFKSGTTPTDLDSGLPTITITKPDGTTIAPGTISHPSTGTYSFTLAGQPDPTKLDVTWTGTVGGQPQTLESKVEILGWDLFTIGELRALQIGGDTPFESQTTWPDSKLHEARAATLDEFTQILGFPPVPRFYREVHSIGPSGALLLDQLKATRLLSVTVAGVAQSTSGFYLDGVAVLPVSNYAASSWSSYGYGVAVVEYVAGWPRPMGDGSNVAMLRAAMRLQPGISSTATAVTTPDGVSYSFDAAGQVTQAGTVRHFGVPALDSWLNRWSQPRLAVA